MIDREGVTLIHGDAIEMMATLPDASVDAVVTDPPYSLSFMGKGWDSFTPKAFEEFSRLWATEAYRVLKPGGHLLAFGGTRTYHRLTSGIEDAGFEIRDSIFWLHGQGFPKSLNVSRDPAFCQCSGVEWNREATTAGQAVSEPTSEHEVSSLHDTDVPEAGRTAGRQGPILLAGLSQQGSSAVGTVPATGSARRAERVVEGWGDAQAAEGQLHRPDLRQMPAGSDGDGASGRLRDGASPRDGETNRPPATADRSGGSRGSQPAQQCSGESAALPVERGSQAGRGWPICDGCGKPVVSAGLGTALKPASEPIVVARKPLAGTVVDNVLTHGTGAINVDGCRVGDDSTVRTQRGTTQAWEGGAFTGDRVNGSTSGRWPTNVVMDDAAGDEVDRQSGTLTSGANPTRRGSDKFRDAYGEFKGQTECVPHRGASRFYPVFRYQAKASAAERPQVAGVSHPTVKPLELMRWLCRLVTPAGGTVLEPFAGSGTTVEAAVLEGFRVVAIEREAAYLPLIAARFEAGPPVAEPESRTTAEGFKVDRCRSCDAEIIWASTGRKSMPVDVEPSPDGTVELTPAAAGARAVVWTDTPLFDIPLRKSHFATCPQADEWRRKA